MKKIHFKVIYATSQDNDFRAVQLNEHSVATKGWMSERYCTYPQEIILELEHLTRIHKIQILSHHCFIASKIDFFVGSSNDRLIRPKNSVQYKNIGYVELSDNEKSDYQSRELKSAYVDVVGGLLKLIIHKNHFNRLNLYSQVGIIAINVLGIDPVEEYDKSLTRRNQEDERYPQSYDYISSVDDVAFDLYHDPEVANIIRQLDKRKRICTREEDFEEAQKLKTAIYEINELGSNLVRYEIEKRKAAEREDFDLAIARKTQADEIRAKIYEYLRRNNLLNLIKSSLSPLNPPNKTLDLPKRAASSYDVYPDSPKPAIISPLLRNDSVNFNRAPSRAKSPFFEDDMAPLSDVDVDGDEQQDEYRRNRRQLFVLLREAFGLPLARASLSRQYNNRLKALKNIHYEMQHLEPLSSRAGAMLNACSALLEATTRDVPNMFRAGLTLLKFILTEFISKQRISRNEGSNFLDKLFPVLLAKTEDPVQSLRNSAKGFITEMSEFKDVKPLHVVPRHCTVPLKPSESGRLALSRTELISSLYQIHKLNSGFTLENVMTFASGALEHASGDVRKVAANLIIAIYRDVGEPVRDYLPPDDKKIRKNILYRHLFDALERIDGKPRSHNATDVPKKSYSTAVPAKQSNANLQRPLNPATHRTSNIPIPRSRNPAGSNPSPILTNRPVNPATYEAVSRPMTSTTYHPLPFRSSDASPWSPEVKSSRDTATFQPNNKMNPITARSISKAAASKRVNANKPSEDRICIFCGENNENFLEEGLNFHYWKSCPMLMLCPHCGQIVEVSGLISHQMKHCKRRDKLSVCPRCSEMIPFEKFHRHLQSNKCPPADKNKYRCPLCHKNFAKNSDSWKHHLMGNCGENFRFLYPAISDEAHG